MLLFLAIELAEHVVVALWTLLMAVMHAIRVAEHLVDLHTIAPVLRRIGRPRHRWRGPALHSCRVR